MKIIVFPASYLPILGGVQEVAFRLAKQFRKNGHRVIVLTERFPRHLKASEVIDGIPVYRIFISPTLKFCPLYKYVLGLFLAPFSLLRLLFLLWREKPEVVYLHFVGIGSFYLLACRLLIPFKLIVTLHGDDVEGLPFLSRFHKWLFVKTCKSADFVTACSKDLLQKGRTLCPGIDVKSTAIHNGVNLAEFQEIKAYKHTCPYIFAAGRFVYKKGFDILIKAFHRLVKKGYKVDLILAGEGEEIQGYKKFADSLGVTWLATKPNSDEGVPKVIFWGRANRNEMKSLLAGSEIFVVPSRKEPFGLVVLEAMAAGTPVVATRVGGIPEIVLENEAVLVPPENEISIADAIEDLLNDRDLRNELIRKGKERVQEFSWEVKAQSYLNIT